MHSNFHTHSTFCDGKSTLGEHIEKAIELNLKSLGFSSHAPLPFDCTWCMKLDSLYDYLKSVQSVKQSAKTLEVYSGMEVDYIPHVISPADFNHQLDYTIGSIHFVDAFDHGKHWEIDGMHNLFLEGLEKIFHNDHKAAFTRYFELTREMVNTSPPTIIGHLDKMKIQNLENKFFKETESWYQQQVKETLNAIKKSGSIIEINTRGIYQKKSIDPYPSPWILEIIHQENIPITISSDAHHANDLINHFQSTALLLLKIGFRKISILTEGEWKSFSFDQNGIIH